LHANPKTPVADLDESPEPVEDKDLRRDISTRIATCRKCCAITARQKLVMTQ
jgi:hypothetical protein